jgi:SAM-dependent MidA family methyltransferase
MSGLVIANEFFDALPVHVLRKERNGWKELCVGLQGGEFAFVRSSQVDQALIEYAQRYGRNVEAGGVLEVSLAAQDWVTRVSAMLTKGRFLIIDYGYDASELGRFPAGSLMCYRRHHAGTEVLRGPGTKDISAHVNFTALRDSAVCSGLTEKRTCSLSAWARSIWGQEEFGRRWEQANVRWRLQWKQIVFGLGETFRVLEFQKQGRKEKAPERPGGGGC